MTRLNHDLVVTWDFSFMFDSACFSATFGFLFFSPSLFRLIAN